ncbi:non-specific lipid transfer protein GPI-anchored 2-like [Iris pallida]|uniref:Non-specific lipid transfer protein GPI-anchored 2-like n=1 Tax=Iris pallida TaxID=29817 RepID=A0AAX6E1K8_IRIPA|nr:non-specific lipid transfer protein GPI-anchored 2-like [Iris pallida]
MTSSGNAAVAAVAVLAAVVSLMAGAASGQITTACTSSLITTFTPCMNVITGSTNGGGSPSAGCCDALAELISSSSECACLIFTGNVPLISRTLAITLPSMCKSKSVPLQCKATTAPLPSPGSVALAPTLPPLPPFAGTGSTGSDSISPSTPSATEPASPPAVAAGPTSQGMNQGKRPLVVPNSAAGATANLPIFLSSSVLVMVLLGTFLLNN